jgi:hypothetical protein
MREICIPLANFGEDEIAEVTLTVGHRKINYSFRIESFPWDLEGTQLKEYDDDSCHASIEQIMNLRKALATYEKSWELVQIFTPCKGATHIQVLYRKRN